MPRLLPVPMRPMRGSRFWKWDVGHGLEFGGKGRILTEDILCGLRDGGGGQRYLHKAAAGPGGGFVFPIVDCHFVPLRAFLGADKTCVIPN